MEPDFFRRVTPASLSGWREGGLFGYDRRAGAAGTLLAASEICPDFVRLASNLLRQMTWLLYFIPEFLPKPARFFTLRL